MKDPILGYGRAISALRNASGGRYAGPEVSEAALRSAYGSIDGLDTAALRMGARVAAGDTQTAGVQQWLIPVIKFIGSLGAGMVASELMEKAQDWFTNRDEAEEVADAAGRAADAIDTTIDESDQGTAAMLAQLTEIIAQISAHLATIDPTEHPEAFISIVQAGADIINDAAAMILGVCADRDKAIEECYCALIDHGQRVCEKPHPELADAVSGGMSGAVAGGSSGGAVDTATAAVAASGASVASGGGVSADSPTPAVTSPASVEVPDDKNPDDCEPEPATKPCPEETPAPEPADDGGSARGEEPTVICDEPTEEPADEVDEPEPEPGDQQDNQLRNTLIGALGVGMLIAGVGVIVHFLEQAFQDAMAGMQPAESAPEPAPAPAPASESVNDKTPESELHLVPEPPAKPVPAGIQAAFVSSPEHLPGAIAPQLPAETPIPVSNTEQVEQPPGETVGEPVGEPQGRVRKVGGW